ncbi:MAG: SLBB domain-containing protein [Saprospiraceae bacterium]|nr:SLBB domain-containing protein [Saprospiraceae bacterium]
MNFFRRIIVVIPFFLWLTTLVAQVPGEATMLAEHEKRGYDAQRVRQEFLARGFDETSFQSKDPAVLSQLKDAAKEIVNVLEEEKKASSYRKESSNSSTTVNDNKKNLSEQSNPALKIGGESQDQMLKPNEADKKKTLSIYGQQIFQDKTLDLFRSVADAKPSEYYILGAGDQVTISIWGPTQENFTLEIQKEGYIQPTGLKRFYLAGMSLAAAKDLMFTGLKSKYYFAKENFELTVTAARTVNVNIVGEVFQNGTYNLSAVNTAFNALVAAGGPTEIGSVRKIQLLRAGKKPLVLDVYRFLQNPLMGYDFQLQENDYIHVPVAEKIISVKGAVNRPFQYELLAGEHLIELLGFAGGLTSGARKRNIRIRRMEGDTTRIIDIDYTQLEKGGKNYILVHGDVIEIDEIDDLVKNRVNVSGGVIMPGVYALTPGMRVSDVVAKAELQVEAITEFAYLFRKGSVNAQIKDYIQINLKQALKLPGSEWDLELRSGDSLAVYVRDQFTDASVIRIEGAVRNPGQFKYSPSLSLKDVILLAGGAKREAALDRMGSQ